MFSFHISVRVAAALNKSSAVAEMGDPLDTWAENWEGLLWGRWVPTGSSSNTMWPGPRPSSMTSGTLIHAAIWPQQIWAENWGYAPLGEGSWVPT